MKNMLAIFLLILFSCSEKKPEPVDQLDGQNTIPEEVVKNDSLEIVDTQNLTPIIDGAEYELDNIIVGFKEVDSTFYNQIIKKQNQNARSNLRDFLKASMYDVIDWDQKLSIFLNMESAVMNLDDTYGLGIKDNFLKTEADTSIVFTDPTSMLETTVGYSNSSRSLEYMWFLGQELSLFQENYFSRPSANTLELYLDDNKKRVFEDDLRGDTTEYHFGTYLSAIDCYYISKNDLSNNENYLVRKKDGETFDVWGIPGINESVNIKTNYIYNVEKESKFDHGIEILGFRNNKVQFVSRIIDDMSVVSDIKINDLSSAVIKLTYDLETDNFDYTYVLMEIREK